MILFWQETSEDTSLIYVLYLPEFLAMGHNDKSNQ